MTRLAFLLGLAAALAVGVVVGLNLVYTQEPERGRG